MIGWQGISIITKFQGAGVSSSGMGRNGGAVRLESPRPVSTSLNLPRRRVPSGAFQGPLSGGVTTWCWDVRHAERLERRSHHPSAAKWCSEGRSADCHSPTAGYATAALDPHAASTRGTIMDSRQARPCASALRPHRLKPKTRTPVGVLQAATGYDGLGQGSRRAGAR